MFFVPDVTFVTVPGTECLLWIYQHPVSTFRACKRKRVMKHMPTQFKL